MPNDTSNHLALADDITVRRLRTEQRCYAERLAGRRASALKPVFRARVCRTILRPMPSAIPRKWKPWAVTFWKTASKPARRRMTDSSAAVGRQQAASSPDTAIMASLPPIFTEAICTQRLSKVPKQTIITLLRPLSGNPYGVSCCLWLPTSATAEALGNTPKPSQQAARPDTVQRPCPTHPHP